MVKSISIYCESLGGLVLLTRHTEESLAFKELVLQLEKGDFT